MNDQEAETYQQAHRSCPRCGKTHNKGLSTFVPVEAPEQYRDEHRATCTCGWKGIVHDLSPTTMPGAPTLFNDLLSRQAALREEQSAANTRNWKFKYRLVVTKLTQLIADHLTELDLEATNVAVDLMNLMGAIGNGVPTDAQMAQLQLVLGPPFGATVPPDLAPLYNALHRK